jgi:acyl-CoA thioester hydrolase
MAGEFRLTRRVDFVDTDMAGIMHFSNFFRLMEAAEAAFFRELGLSLFSRDAGRSVEWPRVHVECDFKHPLRFEDRVEVHLLVREKRRRSIVYDFIFRRLDESPPLEVARGSVVAVCATRDARSGKLTAVPIPSRIADLFEAVPMEPAEPTEYF